MMQKGLLFPGQGSQYIGMGQDFFHEFSLVQELFQEAEDTLSLPLSKIVFDGDEDTLRQTRHAQPALFTLEACMVRVMEDTLGLNVHENFACVAGHSLGEYTALYAAKSLGFAQALRLISRRCEAMQRVKDGGMMAVLGLTLAQVHEAVSQVQKQRGICAVSNENTPVQTVVSGRMDALALFVDVAKAMGAAKVVPLNVSGPFHCHLMQPTQDAFAVFLIQESLDDPLCPVITNVTGCAQSCGKALLRDLQIQMTHPVLWVKTQDTLVHRDISQCVEMGPGRVLAGLARKTMPAVRVSSIGSVKDLTAWVSMVQSSKTAL
jgi:[acyl-carrier-protein] S-malonyltransferase